MCITPDRALLGKMLIQRLFMLLVESLKIIRYLTRPFSTHRVSMTMARQFCSHTMRQKSSMVAGKGPCVQMNSRFELKPCLGMRMNKIVLKLDQNTFCTGRMQVWNRERVLRGGHRGSLCNTSSHMASQFVIRERDI